MKRTLDIRIWIIGLVALAGIGCAGAPPQIAQPPFPPPSSSPDQPNTPRGMTAVDMVELPRLTAAALSPDGQWLVYARTRVDWRRNSTLPDWRLLSLSGDAAPSRLSGPVNILDRMEGIYWRPDSSGFATRVRTDADAAAQIYFFDLATSSLTRLTEHAASVEQLIWSPDGDSVYFFARAASDEADEKDWTIAAYDEPLSIEGWRLDMASGEATSILTGNYSVAHPSISRDGRYLVYVRAPDARPDSIHRGEIWAMDLADGRHVQWTDNGYGEFDPKLSPSGQLLAYRASVDSRGAPYFEPKVFLQALGGAPVRILSDEAFEAIDFAWDKDGSGLFILANVGLRTQLFRYDLETAEAEQLTHGDHAVRDWSYHPERDQHTARIATAASPGEISLAQGPEPAFAEATSEYDDWRAQFSPMRQDAVSWTARDGQRLEGVLVYPSGYEEGRRYPLIVIIHGGPRTSSQFGGWSMSRALPVFAAQGYAVFLPNHRGGTGYGDAFMRDMYGGYFKNAHLDVLDGVEALVESGLADPDRLIAHGWSAGGHMVNKLITYTDQFAAASSGAGVADWLSLHGESDVRHMRNFMFGGSPFDAAAPYGRYAFDSPLRDVWKTKTPTLFWSGANDVRVPPTQSILMHRGVRAAGAPTELFIAPREGHNFREPKHRLFKLNKELEWYATHALGQSYTPVYPRYVDRAVASEPNP